MNQLPLIELRNVIKIYPSEAGDFTALRGIDLSIQPGEFLGVVGKSGAGKSTFLNMLTGVDHATSGEVIVRAGREVSIHRLNEDELASWRGQTMGVVYQSFQLLPMLTLLENVMLPMDLCGLYSPRRSRERALELLRLVEIDEHAQKLPAFISGGQQQRVAIARALANDPAILVADEPTGSLDSVTADHIFDVFEKLVEAGKTIVMVTHDSGLTPRFSRHLVIADGEIAATTIAALPARAGAAPQLVDQLWASVKEEQGEPAALQEAGQKQEDGQIEPEPEFAAIVRAWPQEKDKKKKDKKKKDKDGKKKDKDAKKKDKKGKKDAKKKSDEKKEKR
ncbi:MAG: ABC transporter ATP-binding protein [Anaerolineales bacterium]|nr:ABC transporter ATP-binding protein [Anaerolineales bacterium]